MEDVIKILILEDYADDAELMKRQISKAGVKYQYLVVQTRKEFMTALQEFKPNVILSDYNLPTFNGMQALMMRHDLAPTTPFILVTSSLNEDTAVECMKAGADDYVIKQNLTRLVPAIQAAIKKQDTIRQKMETEEALRESERVFRKFFANMSEGVCLCRLVFDKQGNPVNYEIAGVNRQFEKIAGIPERNLIGRLATDITNNPVPFNLKQYMKAANEDMPVLFEHHLSPPGKDLIISISPWIAGGFAAIVTDMTSISRSS